MGTGKLIGLVALVSFLGFVFIDANNSLGTGMLALWIISSLIITGLLGCKILPHYIQKKGRLKGAFIGGLLILVLIPLVFMGTCALNAGGTALSGLFHR